MLVLLTQVHVYMYGITADLFVSVVKQSSVHMLGYFVICQGPIPRADEI